MNKLSIITINFNNADGLKKTIESIASQTFSDFEYIVIDGGSTDGSVEVIEKYSDKITYWVSEKDKGIFNAQNKGIEKANGEYCLFLNSGDYLVNNDVLTDVFKQNHTEDIIYGDMMIDWGNGIIRLGKMPDTISFFQMVSDTLWHPVSFIKRQLFEQYGNYDESYKMVADYEFFFRTIIMKNVSTFHIPLPISVYNVEGLSSVSENKTIEKTERRKVLNTYLPGAVVSFAEDQVNNILIKRKKWFWRLKNKLKQ
jgi:glycosyltransferase involved in cell wall biosynthesis